MVMRINAFVAQATGISRRAADQAISSGQVKLNNQLAQLGDQVSSRDKVEYNDTVLSLPETSQTILFNKPVGYVSSRQGQGSRTIYDLLPAEYHELKPVGRLDKDSSGLLLLTNDGKLAHELTHPSFSKQKIYQIELDKTLSAVDHQKVEAGVRLEDGLSRLKLMGQDTKWTITMTEGRNRQIRRTFEALGYKVIKLHRTQFGEYKINKITEGNYLHIE